MIDNEALDNIVETMADPAVVVEVYAETTTPTADGFDPEDALGCFANVSGIIFREVEYTKLVRKYGNIKRNIATDNNTTIDFLNFERQISNFEFEYGFEGLILVVRLLSRSQSVELSDTLLMFTGKCEQPKSGTKERLSVTAKFILSALDVEIPRRKFTPEDQEGRTRDNPDFEGFPHIPQTGVGTYSIRRKRGGIAGLLGMRKTERKTLPWSSFSETDTNRDVPEVFGRAQLEAVLLGYADVGTYIKIQTAFCEGRIEDFLNARSLDSRFPLDGSSYHEAYGEAGNVGAQSIDINWAAPGYYSRTAHIRCQANNTAADETDPAPDIVAVILGKWMLIPNPTTGVWNVLQFTDNPAAIPYFAITSPYYWNLHANWIHANSFTEAFNFNDTIIFDNSWSDFLFVPDSESFAELVETTGNNYYRPTSSISTNYFLWLKGLVSATDAFGQTAKPVTYDGIVPIDPPPPDPDDPGGGMVDGLSFYLRRRYTFNGAVTEKMRLFNFITEVVFPVCRMFWTQAENGQIKLNHKKPVDWALGTDEFTLTDEINVDDVSSFINNFWGHLLIDPHTNKSEVRDIIDANYDAGQNDIVLTASDNITVTGFSGCDGENTPATATLLVTDPMNGEDPSSFTLDGTEISFTAGEEDTEETIAAFIYASINAHPQLNRRFRAVWVGGSDEVTIYAKFGRLFLDSNLGFTHDAPLDNPTTEPTLAATAAGSLPAGAYRVAYAYENEHGQTLLSPYEEVTLTADQKITVSSVTLPTDADSIVWYVVPTKDSRKLRFHSRNDGSGFVINSLPLLTAPLPPDLNRTGTEVMRVAMVFSDRAEERSNTTKSNVIKATYEWLLGNREKPINRVDLKYRDATQDFRLIELRLRDDAHIAKTGKVSNLEVNGSGIDNYHQAYRIASGILAEYRDADFFYRWSAIRRALLLQEGDVVCITDNGTGFYNLPVRIEEINFDNLDKGMPRANFVARKYSTTLYDDLVAERDIPVVLEGARIPTEGEDFDEDAAAFFTATSTEDETIQSAVDQLVLDLKAASIWTKFYAIYPIVGGTSAAHAVNLKSPGTFDLTFSGTWNHTSTGMTPTNSHASTGFNPSTHAGGTWNTNNSLSFFSQNSAASSDGWVMGIGDTSTGNPLFGLGIRRSSSSANTSYYDSGNVATGRVSASVSDASGLTVGSCTGASARELYQNGTSLATNTGSDSAGAPNGNIYIGSLNPLGNTEYFQNHECAFAAIGQGLSDAEVTALNTIVNDFQTALGR